VEEDLGSGCLVDLSEYGVSEPTVGQSIVAGVSVVMVSAAINYWAGHKAGIIAGKKEALSRGIRRFPLFRALRVDKLTMRRSGSKLLGLIFVRPGTRFLPFRMIRATPQELKRRAENFIRELRPELLS